MLLQTSSGISTGYGAALFETLIALVGVCVLAVVVLRWAASRGIGRVLGSGAMEIVERLPLDARRSLYLVRVAGKAYVIGVGDSGAPALLTEVDANALPAREASSTKSFRAWLSEKGPRDETIEAPRTNPTSEEP